MPPVVNARTRNAVRLESLTYGRLKPVLRTGDKRSAAGGGDGQ
jgi:hypothetical protein